MITLRAEPRQNAYPRPCGQKMYLLWFSSTVAHELAERLFDRALGVHELKCLSSLRLLCTR